MVSVLVAPTIEPSEPRSEVPEIVFRRNPHTEEFEYLSASVEGLTGFSAEEMCGLGLAEILARVHPEDCLRLAGAVEAIAAGGRTTIEYRFQHKDGQYRWIAEDTEFLCDRDGTPLYRFGFLRDISAQKPLALAEAGARIAALPAPDTDRRWTGRRFASTLAAAAGIVVIAAGSIYWATGEKGTTDPSSAEVARKLSAENTALRLANDEFRQRIDALLAERAHSGENPIEGTTLASTPTLPAPTHHSGATGHPRQPAPRPRTAFAAPSVSESHAIAPYATAMAVSRIPAENTPSPKRALTVQPVAPDPPSVR